MITLHGRTRKQGFSGKSDWEMIGRLKKLLEIPVIANGDIKNPDDALNCLKKTNADGVMIGRGILGSPWKIGEIDYAIRENKNFKVPNTQEKLYLIIEHLDELIKEELSELQKETGCPDSFIYDFIGKIQNEWHPESCHSIVRNKKRKN